MYIMCIETLKIRNENFKALTAVYPADLIDTWEAMDTTPKVIDGEVFSVYEAHVKNGLPKIVVLFFDSYSTILGPPTLRKTLQKLVNDEQVAELAGEREEGDAQLINRGICLEDEQ